MNADDPTNGPDAEPSSATVRRATPSPPYVGPHGVTITPPGFTCARHAGGTLPMEQVAISRSYGARSG